jgi:hypothetical protein
MKVLSVVSLVIGLVALVMAVRCRRRVSGRWGADGFVEALRERGLVVCEL